MMAKVEVENYESLLKLQRFCIPDGGYDVKDLYVLAVLVLCSIFTKLMKK